MPSTWYQLTVRVPVGSSEAVANFLIEHGSPGLQLDEDTDAVSLTAYFQRQPPVTAILQFCAQLGCALSVAHPGGLHLRRVADEDWAESWKHHFTPRPIGRQLYVCPPWERLAPSDRLAIVINPGMVFGTGQHATTRGCLELLEHAARKSSIARALDLGTGSGILAIALAKLGVPEIWAVDVDPVARAAARDNARAHGVGDRIRFAGEVDAPPGYFDLIVANLFAHLLEELAAQLVARLRPGGTLIAAGFLLVDEDRLRARYDATGVIVTRRFEDAGWVTLTFAKTAAQ
jgi:ribosomal protein L11 methyltransferase